MKSPFKPNQFVRVQEDGYMYIGEAMSFETPDHTVMVRRVPGHPGTLEEQPVDKLVIVAAPGMPKIRYVHYAVVAGTGSFPVDMLRYDMAAPVNFCLVEKPRRHQLYTEIDPAFGFKELVVARASHIHSDNVWTKERWRSFLWSVRPLKTETLGKEAL